MSVQIRDVRDDDAQAICDIYNYYINETIITFEEEPLAVTEIEQRINTISADYPYIVAEDAGSLVGYAYANYWRTRSAYRHTVETTIYLDQQATGKGYGKPLYVALLDRLRSEGFHVAMGVIGLPNTASEVMHEQLGFRRAGHFKEVGKKFGKWADVAYWELQL